MLNEAQLPPVRPVSIIEELTIRAEAADVRRASLWLENIGKECAVPPALCSRLELCLNEALANIMFHGGEKAIANPIFLRFDIARNPDFCEAAVTVSDAGIKFDLLEAVPKAIPQSLADAEPGGLGLLMLRQFTDDLHYCYRDGRNYLNFAVRWIIEP